MKIARLRKEDNFWDAPSLNKDYKEKFILSITNSDLLLYSEKKSDKKKVYNR